MKFLRVARSSICGTAVFCCALLTLLFIASYQYPVFAQMVSPSIDKAGEPFSYFSRPTDEIGVMDAPAATEVTPEGYLYTGYGELMFFSGEPLTPVDQRVKTLEEGYLPIVHYSWSQQGITYALTTFAASLDGKPEGQIVNFVRVVMQNQDSRPNRADFAVGVRYQADSNLENGNGDNRFRRPVEGDKPGHYRQIGESFQRDWEYRFEGNAFLRGGEVMYVFPSDPQEKSFTLKQSYNNIPDLRPRKLGVMPTTPVGITHYQRMLKPGEEATLIFKMPLVPLKQGEDPAPLQSAAFDTYLAQTSRFWHEILDRGLRIELPEAKVTDTYKASLVYDLMARDKLNGSYIQTVNKLHYHSFYLRDASDIVRMYEVTGYPDIARQVLDFFPYSQQPDGNFLSQEQQYDGWGEAMWAYGQHYRMTHDRAFAEQVFPSIVRAVAWLHQARQKDPLHLMPASDVKDNEYVAGHLTGYNFLALSGLKNVIVMADALKKTADAAAFRAEYDDYRAAFLKLLDQRAAENAGYIPPALDGQKDGRDWGNLLSIYPEETLDPHDPRVGATLKNTQARYQEGLITYADGRWIHHYLTIKNTLSEVIRGEQEQAVTDLYALLLHTSSTQAGFEFAIRPWGTRDFEDNLSPHGWFAAEYRTLLRNMLVREEGRDLHLMSVVSPEWIDGGKRLAIENAPTEFGTISYVLEQPSDEKALLHLNAKFANAPEKIWVHVPWFETVASVLVDGKPAQIQKGAIELSPAAKEVQIVWKRQASIGATNYQAAVDAYKTEYRRRFDEEMHGVAK